MIQYGASLRKASELTSWQAAKQKRQALLRGIRKRRAQAWEVRQARRKNRL
jgi:predicted Fe-S protein YdhL (DUF1289 family)